jgi:hypothetical protein
MTLATIRIVLELDAADHPVGTAALPGGEPHAFHGWLELVTTIAALSRTPEAAPAGWSDLVHPIEGEPR